MPKQLRRSATDVNRAHWNALAAVHGTGNDHVYDVDALVAGTLGLDAVEEQAVALAADDVAGRDVLHSYANPHAIVASPQTIEHAHSLGEVVTAAIQAGLRITALREHLAVEGDPRGTVLVPDDDGLTRLRIGGTALPVLYTLVAGTEPDG